VADHFSSIRRRGCRRRRPQSFGAFFHRRGYSKKRHYCPFFRLHLLQGKKYVDLYPFDFQLMVIVDLILHGYSFYLFLFVDLSTFSMLLDFDCNFDSGIEFDCYFSPVNVSRCHINP
jgi:hypothetical protein